MKPKILIIIAALLLLGGGFAACDDSDVPLPYTEYYSQPAFWNLDYDLNGDNVTLVNSDEEFQQYFIGAEFLGTEFSPVDFSQHTLVLICGRAGETVSKRTITNLRKLSANKYRVDVEVITSSFYYPEPWVIAVLTDKVSGSSEVELNVTYNK